jgi:hypothetical protein
MNAPSKVPDEWGGQMMPLPQNDATLEQYFRMKVVDWTWQSIAWSCFRHTGYSRRMSRNYSYCQSSLHVYGSHEREAHHVVSSKAGVNVLFRILTDAHCVEAAEPLYPSHARIVEMAQAVQFSLSATETAKDFVFWTLIVARGTLAHRQLV